MTHYGDKAGALRVLQSAFYFINHFGYDVEVKWRYLETVLLHQSRALTSHIEQFVTSHVGN